MTKETVTIEVPADAKITINGETWTPPKTNGLPVPTEDNKGWIINTVGAVLDGGQYHLYSLLEYAAQGNWFPTRAQAELALRQRATKRLMKEISAKDGFVDWSNRHERKYSITFNYDKGNPDVTWYAQIPTEGTTYFLTEERAQEAIDTIGKDAIKELFLNPNQPQEK